MKGKVWKKWKWFPPALMVCSMLTLAVFFVFWIVQAWDREKDWLDKELNYLFLESYNQIQDSLQNDFLAHRFQLALQDTAQVRESLTWRLDGDRFDSGKQSGQVSIRVIKADQDSIFTFQQTSDAIVERTFNKKKTTVIKEEHERNKHFHKHGHKRSLHRLKFLAMDSDTIMLDSLLLLSKLEENLLAANIDLPVFVKRVPYENDTASVVTAGLSLPLPGSYPLTFGYAAGLEKQSSYVFLKTLPEILIALVLLLLVGFAFLNIWNNMKRHEKLNMLKNDFISNITHELKTPVATVSVAIEALQMYNEHYKLAKTADYLDMASMELKRLDLLVDKIMKTALFDQGKMNLEIEEVDLKVLAEQVKAAVQLNISRKGASLNFQWIGEDFRLEADASHLCNVLINLIDNAIKYHPGQATITFKAERVKDEMLISISDDGPGISPEYSDKVFERFFRVPDQNRHNVKGHGLGLSYVKDIVQRHGGNIALKQELSKGACFLIKWPLLFKEKTPALSV